ncbi:MobF family relaxase [Pseudonocardia halophobica]|uniref:MobF family relaxase n=1 Tax=Pseudonocardia halophobica TaxID=29401 RepID=UPI003D913048
MLSISTGHDVAYLTGPVAGGREGYYTGAVAAGEPAGLWYGAGAELLGLRGEVDADLMEAVYSHLLDPRDPATRSRATWGQAETFAPAHRKYRTPDELFADLLATQPGAGPEERAALRGQAERSARQAVSFIDVTFSAPKSVTVLGVAFERAENNARAAGDAVAAAAWGQHRRAVEDAVLAGARASIDYLADVAGYARVGHHGGGAGRWTDAHEWVVAQFLQHDSRDRDPQLHVHQAILNRAPCADGSWRALDGRAIHDHRGAAGAVGERVMEAHLTRALGVRFAARPDGHGREITGIRQEVLDLFSSRRRAITAKTQTYIDAFTERFGREPSPLERTRLSQQATLATRAAKAHNAETLEQRLDRWEAETRSAVTGGLGKVAHTVLDLAQQQPDPERWSPEDVIERALTTAADRRQSWTRSDLTRAISDALPAGLDLDPGVIRVLLDQLTDQALDRAVRLSAPDEDSDHLPAELRLADGRSVYQRPGGVKYTTVGQMAAERHLRLAAVERGAPALTAEQAQAVVARFAESGHGLGADQAAAVTGILSSGARVEVLSAAAGTGKSFTVAAIAEAWTASGREAIGLAPSQAAANVLTAEGLPSVNTARWLATNPQLSSDTLVVVDEAGMASTTDLTAIHTTVTQAGAKLLLVGDPRQLAAVGPGGALADLAEHGLRYQLAEVRRFTHPWERAASLRLRAGDQSAITDYDRHGRIIDAGAREHAETAAARAWLADTLAGKEAILLVGSNEAAARLSAQLRAQLVTLGHIAEAGVELTAQGTTAGVGDLVQARRNGWELLGSHGNTRAPINRETYRITDVLDNGSLRVATPSGAVLTLPSEYVRADLALGYACTVHAAQGRTVDTAHAVIGPGSDLAATYVALTRGRDRNTAYAITTHRPDDSPIGDITTVQPRTGRAVLADICDQDLRNLSALAEHEHSLDQAASMQHHIDRLADGVTRVLAGRTAAHLDQLTHTGALTPDQRLALAADPSMDALDQLLRRVELAGHNPDETLEKAVRLQTLDTARSPAQVLHHRIHTSLDGHLAPTLDTATQLVPRNISVQWRDQLEHHAHAADHRRHTLGTETAETQPAWAIDALGPVPDDEPARAAWIERAGWAAAYRELADHDHPTDPLGAAPPAGLAEKAALWRTAHQALDLPDHGAEEAEATDGQLRVRVAAYQRELDWAPDYVADELADTHRRIHAHHTDAEIWTAHANAATDPDEQQQLRDAAQRARDEAAALTQRAAELEIIDAARARWYAHTATTRDRAERARAELSARGVSLDAEPTVTAEEWLQAHQNEQTQEDQHRQITELDLAEDVDMARSAAPTATSARQLSSDMTSDSTTDAIRRAQLALAKIHGRDAIDTCHESEEHAERAAQLALWAQDRETEQTQDADLAFGR